ncbi:M20/M25/M40 family metallo-hydrolase [Bacillus sp. HMF5848]|uniref:M20/M25/M40 family metallo-hydrolase n=1 Tax=Bacillus sp. HMF5848 TaxID=2495421 RepID=UPI000F780ACB|nr:M20/M25/M40 family metallo-hydrolase [Bacillus sp. HMF5848]RSK27747.1 M20/M25/M40 family metallo-hydrolase [Bacillus sp. HMF5848]
MTKWQTKEQMVDLLHTLVQYNSVTGSYEEVVLPEYLFYQLLEIPYFQQNPNHVQLHPLADGRQFLTALVKNEPTVADTVILLSHFDVVGIEDYGEWKNLAFDTVELTKQFYQHIDKLPDHVKEDLKDEWLFGRGSLDMKAGLTVQLSMIEKACNGEFNGNVLLVTVPDEEMYSAGMVAAVPVLLDLAERWSLQYKMCINSEPMFARYPQDDTHYIYTGSIGKILAGFLSYGTETHVGEPFGGISANYMISEVNRHIELNTEFCETIAKEVTPPPVNLYLKDLKTDYSVQTPHAAAALYNIMMMEKNLPTLINDLKKVAIEASSNISNFYKEKLQERANIFSSIKVFTFSELYDLAVAEHGEQEVLRGQHLIKANHENISDNEMTIKFAEYIASLCHEYAPMLVVFLAAPYYPAVCSSNDSLVKGTLNEIKTYARDTYNIHFVENKYFNGLSDLSFININVSNDEWRMLSKNMPYNNNVTEKVFKLPTIKTPVMNVGPFGRDPHKWTERIHCGYSFETYPDILHYTIKKVIG